MFHVKHAQLVDVLRWVGHDAPASLLERLQTFEAWLGTEGAAGGGIGPNDVERAWERHVLDSLLFSRGAGASPARILDLGSGIGLPGIPLAALFPDAEVVLVDRSGRRMELARRGARVAGLRNVSTIQADFKGYSGGADLVVMRASLQPSVAVQEIRARLEPGAVGVLGLGLTANAELAGADTSNTQERFPGSEVLDPGRWLHIMRR